MKLSKLLTLMFLLAPLLAASDDQVVKAEPGTINGSVYCDQNQDGKCDCEEGGLKDIHIQIFSEHCGGTAMQTIHTDKEGNFSFHIPEPGQYFVMVDLDYVCGGRVPTTSVCQEVVLAAGETVTLIPFGYSSIGQ
ncbi:SdrD B-like domain-containing protein [Pseudomonadota bacterium]